MPQNIDHECGDCKTDHSSQPSAQFKMCGGLLHFPPCSHSVGPKAQRQLYLCCIIKFPYTKVGRNCSHQFTTYTESHVINLLQQQLQKQGHYLQSSEAHI